MWAAHVKHHSSERLNLSTAVRQSWTQPLMNRWFCLPLAWLGVDPALRRERDSRLARSLRGSRMQPSTSGNRARLGFGPRATARAAKRLGCGVRHA